MQVIKDTAVRVDFNRACRDFIVGSRSNIEDKLAALAKLPPEKEILDFSDASPPLRHGRFGNFRRPGKFPRPELIATANIFGASMNLLNNSMYFSTAVIIKDRMVPRLFMGRVSGKIQNISERNFTMDIYSFMNSPDVEDHCRNIGHVFNALEMAVIIACSEKTIKEKHEVWREIITDYLDMPIQQSNCFDAQESLHDYLRQVISLDERWLTEFYIPETGAVYRTIVCQHGEENFQDGCYSTADQAWAALYEEWKDDGYGYWNWKEDHIDSVCIIKELVDVNEYPRKMQVNANGDALKCIGHSDGYPDSLDEIFIDLPLPFERGDIIACWDKMFVLDNVPHWNSGRGKKYEEYLTGTFNDRSDMNGWGLFVSEAGVLYGDHTGNYDYYRYYRGKLEGVNRLLHYVSLFIKREQDFQLPELLAMQGRIMLENLIENNLLIKSHGCYIPEHLLAENRLTPEEKEEIREKSGLMPWLAGKFSIHQVEFLVREFGGDNEKVQTELSDGGSWYMGMCAKVVHDENYYAKTNDARFNPARRDMAKMFLEVYDHTENDWIDNHADGNSDHDSIPMPNYSKLKGE